jgi:hypothetical protein
MTALLVIGIPLSYLVMVGVSRALFFSRYAKNDHWSRDDKQCYSLVSAVFWPVVGLVVLGAVIAEHIKNYLKHPKIAVELCPECRKKCEKGPFR